MAEVGGGTGSIEAHMGLVSSIVAGRIREASSRRWGEVKSAGSGHSDFRNQRKPPTDLEPGEACPSCLQEMESGEDVVLTHKKVPGYRAVNASSTEGWNRPGDF